MSANGQPQVEAVTAVIRRGDFVAVLDRHARYADSRQPISLDPAWRVTVQPARGADITGYRDTFEGAQALAVQLLELAERHAETVRAERDAISAMIEAANARPARATAPAATGQDPDEEPPF